MELTPQERERIYEEERIRLDARRRLSRDGLGIGRIAGYAVLGIVALLVFMWIVGSIETANEDPKDAAKREAETCVQAFVLKAIEQGASREEARIAASLNCGSELDKLRSFDSPAPSASRSKGWVPAPQPKP